MSSLFSRTLHEAPADAEIPGHKLLVRAGFIRQIAAGVFAYLPLAKRTLNKIENIMRDEINAIGGQEMTMPVVNPAEIWKQTGRWFEIGAELGRFKDRNDRDMALAMTHEETVAELVRKEIQTYRQMPALIYHIQTKWRDDPRPRAGLIRVREFTMKDSYSLDRDFEGLDLQYRRHYQAYFNIFNRCALPSISVKSDVGMMGGKMAHEFMYLTPIGEDTLLLCDKCGYSANRQVAKFQKPAADAEDLMEKEKVETPGAHTIEELAEFLKILKSKTAKAVFLTATYAEDDRPDQLIMAIVRGDMELSETKLLNAIKAKEMRPATDDEIIASGAVPGYASPMGLKNLLVVVDDIIPTSPNLVAGANEENYHFRNVNYERDYKADIVSDLAAAQQDDACPECGAPLRSVRGVEIGNIFKLGTRYSESMNCKFLDADGKEKFVIMGSYGIGSGRLLACIAEEYNDDGGLTWPITVAPFQVHMVVLAGKDEDETVIGKANDLYKALTDDGIDVLFDDRAESPGVKFNDADLMGMPIRITVSQRSLKNDSVEMKLRTEKDLNLIPYAEAASTIKAKIAELTEAVMQKVVEVPIDF
jgi:prolyl-tRNA synthetase